MTMTILPYNFIIFQYFGLWKPIKSVTQCQSIFYDIYTYLVLILMYLSVFTELIKLCGSFVTFKQLINDSTILLTMMGNCAKAANIFNKRQDIINLINILNSYPCCVQNRIEKIIKKKYDKTITYRTLAYVILVELAVAATSTVSIICDIPLRKLPYKAWYPFNLSISRNYWLAWSHQISAHILGATLCAAYDTLVPGFMLQSCAQFDILNYRLGNVLNNKLTTGNNKLIHNSDNEKISSDIIECVKYHRKIIELCNYTNDIFGSVIFLQFSISTAVICVTVYVLSQTKLNSPDFPALIVYLACMLFELFLFCYAGNEVTLKSEEVLAAIYSNVNWCYLNVNAQKNLLFMMLRSVNIVKFTVGHILDLSINSYNSVLKLSYSMYNVLS